MPDGVALVTTESADVLSAARQVHDASPGRVVVKLPATGGAGNVVLEPSDDAWLLQIEDAWAGRHEPQAPCDVVVESWLPWTTTYSVSFLIAPDRVPTFIAACEQLVDPDTAAFIGSRSRGPLDIADLDAVLAVLLPVFDAMRADGFAGVAGIDVIVGPGTSWSGRGLSLPSGLRMCLIECNPRFNQHNRVGLVVARLARHWDVHESELPWTLRYLYPREPATVESLCSTGGPENDTALPDRPVEPAPVRLLFAHRLDLVMELSLACSLQDAGTGGSG